MRPRTLHLVLTVGSLAAIHCKSEPGPTAAAPVAKVEPVQSAAPAAQKPPGEPFVAPQTWVSRKPGSNLKVDPPDLDQETWRVLITQNKPLQRKTPLWQSLPAREAVELSMPEGVGFRCVVEPVRVQSVADDFNYRLTGWRLTRSMFCSSDSWRSWNECVYDGLIHADGKREFPEQVGALLRERNPDETVRHTFAMIRSDKENRQATFGPPKILTGVKVDTD